MLNFSGSYPLDSPWNVWPTINTFTALQTPQMRRRRELLHKWQTGCFGKECVVNFSIITCLAVLLKLNFLLQVGECYLGHEMTLTCRALSTGIKLYDTDMNFFIWAFVFSTKRTELFNLLTHNSPHILFSNIPIFSEEVAKMHTQGGMH